MAKQKAQESEEKRRKRRSSFSIFFTLFPKSFNLQDEHDEQRPSKKAGA